MNTGPDDFIHGPWEKLETSDKQNNALRSSNKPSSIIVQQDPLHQSLSTTVSAIVLMEAKFEAEVPSNTLGSHCLLVCHDLITGLLVLWGQNYGIQYPFTNLHIFYAFFI